MLIQIIDVAIGLIVVYLIFSTIASSVMELVAMALQRRARMLFRGVEEIFRSAQTLDGNRAADAAATRRLAAAFYRLTSIASLYIGELRDMGRRDRSGAERYTVDGGQLPSYIPAKRFAGAVLSVVNGTQAVPAGTAPADQTTDLKTQCKNVLDIAALIYAAAKPQDTLTDDQRLEALEQFFNDNTERMASWYRRHVHAWLLLIGLVLAGLLNVDTLQIVKVLSQDSALRERIVTQALSDINVNSPIAYQVDCSLSAGAPVQADAAGGDAAGSDRAGATTPADAPPDARQQQDQVEQCEAELREGISRRLSYAEGLGLPLGWSNEDLPWHDLHALLLKFLGWLMTALAICIGAPFWFDLLNRLANIRSVLKPEEEQKPAG